MSKEKTLSALAMAVSGDTRKTWNYCHRLLRELGHKNPSDLSGVELEGWVIAKARSLTGIIEEPVKAKKRKK